MLRIPFDQLHETLAQVLQRLGFSAGRAQTCARLFAETTCDGVYTHGVARFPRFVAMVRNGSIDVAAEPVAITRFGAVERWDGRRGPGNLNALAAMERAMALGREHGVGCVSLGNTNHWMRGGTYGWQAAAAGLIGICWTNTMPNLPPWGGVQPCIGNNPLVIAVPRASGPVVLDMAMSQFSYGALESYRQRGELLPVEGGFDAEGNLTRDPAAIEQSQRPLPTGYWKGSGLSVVLDMMGAMLSLGNATHQLPADPLREAGISQVFLTMNPAAFGAAAEAERLADEIVASVHHCRPAKEGSKVRYPGEKTLQVRAENRKLGLPVDPAVWQQILAM
ncbi:MAG: 3-dehydro-L-gulonate 2-dehydrogenase [Acidobacteriota bacterium]|nr:3-dehydro-L-gulonate 2-dehydrogenase [Acidobacteriota bacterium]